MSALLSVPAAAQFDPFSGSPLLAAAKSGDYTAAEQQVSTGASVNQVDVHGQSAAIIASKEGHCDILILLLLSLIHI